MITIGAACAGRPTRDLDGASSHRAARSLGRREVRRQHPRSAARRGDLDGEAGSSAPTGRHRGDNCDSRRNLVAGAAAGCHAATGLGDVGGPMVPAGLPGRAHRRHGISVPSHRVHAGVRPSFRPLARHRRSRSSPARSAHWPHCCWSAPPAGGSIALSPIRGSRRSTPGCASAAGRRSCRCD